MSKHARKPDGLTPRAIPSLEDCLYHRCSQHEQVRQLNAEEEQTGSECGACIAEEVAVLRYQSFLLLDSLADRLTYGAMLRTKLLAARERLNLLSPGAGDWLNDIDADDAEDESPE